MKERFDEGSKFGIEELTSFDEIAEEATRRGKKG